MDVYRDDLAYIHDCGHGALARDAAARLIDELAHRGCESGTVADLGCGSGIFAAALIEAGYHVLGIDISESMIALSRKRAPRAEFRVGSFVSAELPSSIAVAAVGEVVNYAFDSANDDRARAALFGRIYQALVPGGIFLFDTANPDRAPSGATQRTHTIGPDWAVLVETRAERDRRLLTREITSFRKVDTLYRRDDEVHRLTLLDPGNVLKELGAAGFEAQALSKYKDLSLPAGVGAFLSRKPARNLA